MADYVNNICDGDMGIARYGPEMAKPTLPCMNPGFLEPLHDDRPIGCGDISYYFRFSATNGQVGRKQAHTRFSPIGGNVCDDES